MKRLAWTFVIVFMLRTFPLYGAATLPIANTCGNDGLCSHTSLLLRNSSNVVVQQLVSRTTTNNPPFTHDDPTYITLPPGATGFIEDVKFETDTVNGSTVSRVRENINLDLRDGLESSSAIYTYDYTDGRVLTRFELPAVTPDQYMHAIGQGFPYHRNRANNSNGEIVSIVTMNTGTVAVFMTARVFTPDNSAFNDYTFRAYPGVGLAVISGVNVLGDILITVGTPGVGSGTLSSPVMCIIVNGPTDGHTQWVRAANH